ncbi:hypothetical protein [Bradyrhizobium sp. CCBAU 11386]|uniref:hypothetical protein n=1 Tax=Bradyrhizobium sp. CCBAU 11386 TaxID=1630837 RepID=UPI0023042220|nr:hypothetical protein [Bradyrhizobium sp. CCBAU 11386]
MRMKLFVAALLLPVSAGPIFAQTFDEQAICAAINKPGLFYARSQPPYQYSPVNGMPLSYDRDARFVLITTPVLPRPGRDYEGVWHVRTQTIAELSKRANKAHIYRPPVKTRCSRDVLPAFEGGDRLVTLTAYLDHHLSDPNHPRQKNYDLTRRFHMPVEDVAARDCVWTDDERAYDLRDTYSFSDVSRRDLDSGFEAAMTIVPRAYASSVSYQGLSSEFAYRDTPNGACVSFASPIPTGPVPRGGWFSNAYDDAMQAAAAWKPKSTLLVIKRVEGRRVIPVTSKTITWADR